MTKSLLAAAASLLLALSPVSAQVRVSAPEAPAAPAPAAGAALSALAAPMGAPGTAAAALSAPGLGSAPLAALAALESAPARPAALAALAADPSPAAAFVRAAAASPAVLKDPAVRAAAEKALGAGTVARVAAAVAAVDAAAARDAALAADLADLRAAEGSAASARARAALERIARDFAAARAADLSVSAGSGTGASAYRLSKPSRVMRALRRATLALTLSAGLLNSVPAIAQVPAHQPAVVMTQAAAPAQAGATVRAEDYVRARDINDAIAQWNPGVRLIVIGDVGLSRGALSDLNRSLAGKHWTVLLVQDAHGMTFRDVDGNTRYDLEALQYGIGQGIYRKQGFESFVNPQTGERDGSLFAITLNPKNLYLRNSEAQKNHGLYGETQFKGDLDQWAIANMRSGGDIVGAVKETVEGVDQRLAQAVADEAAGSRSAVASAKTSVEDLARAQSAFSSAHAAAAARLARADVDGLRRQAAAAEAALAAGKTRSAAAAASKVEQTASSALAGLQSFESSYASAQSTLNAASSTVDALDKAAAAFRSEHPKATGALARPAVAAMRETLKSAASSVETAPDRAVASAKSVTEQARAAADAIARHAAGADMLAQADARLKALESDAYRSDASAELVSAKQSLAEARSLWTDGDAGWAAQLDAAKSSLSSAEQTTAAAAAAARTHAVVLWGLIGLLSLLTGGLAFWLNRRARAKLAAAQALYDAWDTGLAKKSNANIDKLMEKVQLYAAVSGQYARAWTGESEKVSAAIRADSGRATLLLSKAKQIHARADALLHPKSFTPGWLVNALWPSRAEAAVRLLQDEPLTFDPKEAEALFGVEKSWRDDLFGDVKSYQPFKKSFNEVIAEFNEKAASAAAAVEKLEYAVTQSGKVIDGAEAGLKAAAGRKAAVASAADGLFAVPSLFEKAVPAGTALVASARETVKTDPMAGVYGAAKSAERIAADATALLDAVASARAGSLAAAYAAEKALSERGVAAAWIGTQAKALSAAAEAAAAALAAGPVAEAVKALTAGLDDLGARASRAAEIARKIDAIVHENADKAESAIVAARAEVGRVLGIDPEKTLREDGADPSDRVNEARRLAAQAKTQLAAGSLDAADASGAAAAKNADDASAIAAASLESLRTQERVSGDRRAESKRLEELTPERAAVLKGIADQFAPSVLDLTAGDKSHPNANGTVSDNVDEAVAAVDAAKAKTEESARRFKAGEVLKAASLLAQAKAHQEIAQARLDEISEKRARLDATVAANAKDLAALKARVTDLDAKVAGDKRAMKPTLDAYAKAKAGAASAGTLVDAKKGDPFKAAAALGAAAAALDSVWTSARNDFDAYAHLQSVLQSAKSQSDKTASLVRDAKGDGVADSPAIAQAYRDHERLVAALSRVAAAAQAEHGDWPALDREASGVLNDSAHVAATLSGELAAAARATSAISSAASQVGVATGWTGHYGVYIPGSPGSGELSSARAALERGDYASAVRYAESAASVALAAIAAAEAEVARKRRAEEEERRRQEEERRRRQQEEEDRRRRSDDNNSSWGGSSSGGGGSSWGGSSSSGGGSSSW